VNCRGVRRGKNAQEKPMLMIEPRCEKGQPGWPGVRGKERTGRVSREDSLARTILDIRKYRSGKTKPGSKQRITARGGE